MVQQITETAFNLDNRTLGPQADAAVVMESGMSREGVRFPQASREGTRCVRERFPTKDRQLFFTSSISILGSVTLQRLSPQSGLNTTIWPSIPQLPQCWGFPAPTASSRNLDGGFLVDFSGVCLLEWPHPPSRAFWDTSYSS